jgi:hypothetical protein
MLWLPAGLHRSFSKSLTQPSRIAAGSEVAPAFPAAMKSLFAREALLPAIGASSRGRTSVVPGPVTMLDMLADLCLARRK